VGSERDVSPPRPRPLPSYPPERPRSADPARAPRPPRPPL